MSKPARTPVICALSGGVDSAVAALRLLRAGQAVEGLHMTNWEDDDGYCTAARDLQDARLVCRELGIPLHHVNFAAEYRTQVFEYFLAEYAAGRTPNPDVLCNREIKFGAFLTHARRLGAERIATGHYARLDHAPATRLLKGLDAGKDQSYFLHAVSREALAYSDFPIGDLTKAEVRNLANEAGLPVFDKPDSTGICFIGERPFREFLARFLPAQPGPMNTPDGETVGEHQGLMYYTLGQRQGLGIGGAGEPWYVVGKDLAANTLLVAQGREHPALYSTGLRTGPVAWIGDAPVEFATDGELRCAVKTRYRQADVPCRVRRSETGVEVRFEAPQWAVTPGQYAVFYRDDECLGGAPIAGTRPASAGPAENLARTA